MRESLEIAPERLGCVVIDSRMVLSSAQKVSEFGRLTAVNLRNAPQSSHQLTTKCGNILFKMPVIIR